MTNRYLLCIERLKKLVPVMEKLGVVAPSEIQGEFKDFISPLSGRKLKSNTFKERIKTFDHAALESVLPDWVFDRDRIRLAAQIGYNREFTEERPLYYWETFITQVRGLLDKVFTSRGQEKLEHMCDLILLLAENNIELKEMKE